MDLFIDCDKDANNLYYYNEINKLTKAIEVNEYDYKSYLNRAFCYEKTELYHLALLDAEKAIQLKPENDQANFRKVKALMGLRIFTKAEQFFIKICEKNKICRKKKTQLIDLIVLLEFGFDNISGKFAADCTKSREAIDIHLSARLLTNSSLHHNFNKLKDHNFYNIIVNKILKNFDNTIKFKSYTIEEKSGTLYSDKARDWGKTVDFKITEPNIDDSLKPTNIWKYNGLRVVNINTENLKMLEKIFSKYGTIKEIKPLKKSKNSVWVFYDNAFSPVKAITILQGKVFNEISYMENGILFPMRLYFAPTYNQFELNYLRPKQPAKNFGECYYWRTTSCNSRKKCCLIHNPANKNIDEQLWMKKRNILTNK